MLVVLVCLDGDAGQRGIGGDVVWLSEHAVTRGEAALKQPHQVDLGAGGGEGIEVQVVDVDIALGVSLGVYRVEDVHLIEFLCAHRAVLEHGAHSGIAVDVGVLALEVAVLCGLEGKILIDLHKAGVHLSGTGPGGAVKDVSLGSCRVAFLYKHLLDAVLDLLYGRSLEILLHKHIDYLARKLQSLVVIAAAYRLCSLVDSAGDLFYIKCNVSAVALLDFDDHFPFTSVCHICAETVNICKAPNRSPRFGQPQHLVVSL